MTTKLTLPWLVAIAVALGWNSRLEAQHYQPFAPADVEVDTELFAPVELDQMGEMMPANTGFFFTYDRMLCDVSRSENAVRDFDGDQAWGNRYEFGYMRDTTGTFDGTGWLASVLHIDHLGEIENRGSFGGVEVMKTWRLKPLHYGSVVEPMLGVRWLYFKDDGPTDFRIDNVRNDLVGPEAGVRWFRQSGRWLVSAEGRFLAAANIQQFAFDGDVTWAPTTEIRAEATYEIFRRFGVRAGYEGTYFFNSIGRDAFDPDLNHEDLFVHALTFGFVFNR